MVMEKSGPLPPIFLIEGQDVGIFASLRDAEIQLEPPDVLDESNKGYDALGRRLRIETDGYATRITVSEDEPSESEQLAEGLRAYLKHVGEERAGDPACDLTCLVELARGHANQPKTIRGALRSLWRGRSNDPPDS